jgi:hypothetical protein
LDPKISFFVLFECLSKEFWSLLCKERRYLKLFFEYLQRREMLEIHELSTNVTFFQPITTPVLSFLINYTSDMSPNFEKQNQRTSLLGRQRLRTSTKPLKGLFSQKSSLKVHSVFGHPKQNGGCSLRNRFAKCLAPCDGCLGNPLLDISAVVPQEVFDK